jgi:hypothetical protein
MHGATHIKKDSLFTCRLKQHRQRKYKHATDKIKARAKPGPNKISREKKKAQ